MTIFPIAAGIVSILYAGFLAWQVLKAPKGDSVMQEIAKAIQEGALAFLKRQYQTIAVVAVLIFIVLWFVFGDNPWIAIGFLTGAVTSALAGILGMSVAVQRLWQLRGKAKHPKTLPQPWSLHTFQKDRQPCQHRLLRYRPHCLQ